MRVLKTEALKGLFDWPLEWQGLKKSLLGSVSSVPEPWSCSPHRSSPTLSPAGMGASVLKTFLFSIIFILFSAQICEVFSRWPGWAVPNTELLPTCVAAHCCGNFLQIVGESIHLISCFTHSKYDVICDSGCFLKFLYAKCLMLILSLFCMNNFFFHHPSLHFQFLVYSFPFGSLLFNTLLSFSPRYHSTDWKIFYRIVFHRTEVRDTSRHFYQRAVWEGLPLMPLQRETLLAVEGSASQDPHCIVSACL